MCNGLLTELNQEGRIASSQTEHDKQHEYCLKIFIWFLHCLMAYIVYNIVISTNTYPIYKNQFQQYIEINLNTFKCHD